MKVQIFDLECDGFNPTKIHVLSVHDGERIKSTNNYDNMRKWFTTAEVIVAHNCIRFDVPVLERLLGVKTKALVIDTLALSWYLFPERVRHGLEWWGEDFGVPKPKINDWENLTYAEYKHRCEEDVRINKLLWDKCWEYLLKLYGTEEEALRCVKYLMFKLECARDQEQLRWKLDVAKAQELHDRLSQIKQERISELSEAMPRVAITKEIKRPTKPYKKNGELSEAGKKWHDLCGQHNKLTCIDKFEYVAEYIEGNPNSTEQIKSWLYSLGWVPETFEFKRNKETGEVKKIPQVNGDDGVCGSVKKLFPKEPKLEVLDGLSVVSHRLGIVAGFIKNVDEEGYIKASVAGLTNTLRFKHSVLVNLPGVDKPYGEDIRGCLTAPDGYELVGSDMASLEDRTKQHYMWVYDPEYVKEMMTDDFDPHIDLAEFAGAISREDSYLYKRGDDWPRKKAVAGLRKIYKGVNYACVYGAGAATVSRTAGVSQDEGEKLVEAYWKRNWAVKKIAEDCKTKKVFGQMWLYNPVSGFYYSLRHDKDRFSTLNQGTGVYCFDTWVKHLKEGKLPIVGQFHDEIIGLVKKGNRDKVIQYINKAMELTNNELQLNRELGCSIQFGDNYAEIH